MTMLLPTSGFSVRPVHALLLSLMSFALSACGQGNGNTAAGPDTVEPVSPLSVTLAWDPVPDPSVTGYVIHYGRSSSNQRGSCGYETSLFVSQPQGTVGNLHPETRYYFSVSSYNGIEGSCSEEVSTVTPALPA
ncbi:MAG: fibronectin type III domain-containing protein [Nitrospira sp.]|nr:fibronectin type III domain-containing protein [Nitrospira sp.]